MGGGLRSLIVAALLTSAAFGAGAQAPGVSDTQVLIGQVAAVSGPAAELGKRMQAGLQAYFAEVNRQGGVNGRQLKLITRDDGYEPEKTAVAAKGLIQDDKVFALAGSVGTPTGLALLPIVTEAKVPLVGMFTGAQALREPLNRQVFHVRASYYDETERIVQHLTTLGLKKIAVFHQNDAYGKAGLDGVTRALAQRQLKPVALGTVERNSSDIDKALGEILAAAPEAVVQIGAYKACAAFIKGARAKGYGGQFFNVSFVGSKALADELGSSGTGVVISQVVPFPFQALSPVVREYQQHMTAGGDKDFDFTSLEGYLTARVLVEGLRRSGKALTREGLVTALESLREHDFGGFTVSYSSTRHQGSKLTDLTIIAGPGRFVR